MSQPRLDADAIAICRKELAEWTHREEVMWRQRAKNNYLTEGDKNTRFFHLNASRRRSNNFISGIKDEMGEWMQEPQIE